MDGNWFAFLVLIAWVPFVAYVFSSHGIQGSVVSCLIAGMLFLPSTVINLPLLPPLDRLSIPGLTVAAAVWIVHRRSLDLGRLPFLVKFFFTLMIVGCLLTVVSNTSPLVVGGTVVKGLTYYEGLSYALRLTFIYLLPFFLGFCIVREPKDLKLILLVLALAALVYSFFIVYELVMSPRLHKIIYGFRQHSFAQTRRFGGWRPMVFMSHGLEVASFMTTCTLAASGIAKAKVKGLPGPGIWVAMGLLVLTVACKSMASWFYMLFVVPAIWFLSPKRQMQAVLVLACLVASYPVLRIADVFPTERLSAQMAKISEDRAESLRFRFYNETIIVDHAREHIIAGWGRLGRSQVYDEWSGEKASVPDGYWLVLLSTGGLIGVLAAFGLLLYPVFAACRKFPKIRSRQERIYVSTLSLIVVVISLDLLPNAMVNPLTYFLPGALLASVTHAGRRRTRKKGRPTSTRAVPHETKLAVETRQIAREMS